MPAIERTIGDQFSICVSHKMVDGFCTSRIMLYLHMSVCVSLTNLVRGMISHMFPIYIGI